ncbi:MAG: thiolase, partial [Pseudomonadota bacterium]
MASDMRHLRGQSAAVGVATFGTGECPGWNSMEMMGKACLLALDDAGLSLGDVDGVWAVTAVHSMPAMSLAEHLGVQPRYSSGSNIGGSSFMAHVLDAAILLDAGLIDTALIAYGSNQRTQGGFQTVSEPMPFEAQYQIRSPINAYALAAARYFHEFGAGREHLAEVAVAARAWAAENPEAFARDPITIQDVLDARMISDPFGKLDICLVT